MWPSLINFKWSEYLFMHDMAIWWATMSQKAILCLKLQSNTTTINLETIKMYSKWTIRYRLLTLGRLIRCKSYLAPVSFSFFFFFTRMLFSRPSLNILIFPADFRLKIFFYYSLIEFKKKNIIIILFNLGFILFLLCCILYISLTSWCTIHQTVISMNIWL